MLKSIVESLSLANQMYLNVAAGVVGVSAVTVMALRSSGEGADAGAIIITAATAATIMVLLATYLGRHAAQRAEKVVERLNAIADGDFTRSSSISGRDEFAWMSWKCDSVQKNLSKIMRDVRANSEQLATAAEKLSQITEQSRKGVMNQSQKTEQVAAAMSDMSSTVHEVARNASSAARAANDANEQARGGTSVVKNTIQSIEQLAIEVERAAETINKLKEDSVNIGTVLDVIRGNQALFVRQDELEQAWRWVEPILDTWANDRSGPKLYTAGTWGPSASSALLLQDGFRWHEED